MRRITSLLILLLASNFILFAKGLQSPQFEPGALCSDPWRIYPHKSDCQKHYQCANGKLQEHTCQGELLWNQALLVCDWPANVQCSLEPASGDDHQGDNHKGGHNHLQGGRHPHQGGHSHLQGGRHPHQGDNHQGGHNHLQGGRHPHQGTAAAKQESLVFGNEVPEDKFTSCKLHGKDQRSLNDFTTEDIEKLNNVYFSDPEYTNKVLLVVNVASF